LETRVLLTGAAAPDRIAAVLCIRSGA